MELYQLKTFVAVADEQHLTRAAERLHISQPAVSAHIKALETEWETLLFDRTPTGMALTASGRRMLEHAREVLDAAERARRAAQSLKGEIAGHLKVGTLADPSLVRLGELFSRTVERYPLLELELHQEMSGAALDGVRDGRLHASFYFGDEPGKDVAAVALRPVVYRVTAPAAWKDKVAGADWNGIAALPWVVTPPTSSHHRMVSRLFREHGVHEPQHHIEADNETVIQSLVVSGVGLSLMREEIAGVRAAAGEIYVWDGAALTTTLWFIFPRARVSDPLLGALLEVLRETWSTPAASAASAAVPAGASAASRTRELTGVAPGPEEAARAPVAGGAPPDGAALSETAMPET